MLIKRSKFQEIKQEIKNNKITAIIGSRQVGKTTIIKELYNQNKEQSNYITFDDPEILKIFQTNIKLFIEQQVKQYKLLFIDEFQYAKNGGKNLKFIHDTENTKIFITGSSSAELTIQSLQYLVGRINIIELYPLTFEEFLIYKDSKKEMLLNKVRTQEELEQLKILFEEYLKYGGYPGVVTSKTKEIELKNLVATYIMKEIKDVLSFKNIFEYETFIKRIALQDGGLINKSDIAQTTDINRNKIEEMLQILNKTYIINIVRPFFTNKIKEQIKSPKIYFQDLGFKNSLIKNFTETTLRQDKGKIYESFVLNQLIKNDYEVKFWNIKNQHEIDFIIQKNNKIIGIEVKSKLTSNKITKNLKRFSEEFKPEIIYILNENIDFERKIGKTKFIFTNHMNISAIINLL